LTSPFNSNKQPLHTPRTMLTDTEKKIISLIQDDLPVHPRPYLILAEKLGIGEEELMDTIRSMIQRGLIRRFGATLRHQNAGLKYNAMVVWNVPEEKVEEVGRLFSSVKEVTHCYQRIRIGSWPYNLYTMVHGSTREVCFEIVQRMAHLSGIEDYMVLFSKREFKKTSMSYC